MRNGERVAINGSTSKMREAVHDFMKNFGIYGSAGYFPLSAQSPLKVGFVPNVQERHSLSCDDAKGPESTAFFVRRQPTDSLWRDGADAAILPPTPPAVASAKARAASRTCGRLSSERLDSGFASPAPPGAQSQQPD